jgi:hypothetical protein
MSIICLVRQGDRLDTNNYKEWQNSSRYKENNPDTSLSDLSFAELLKHIFDEALLSKAMFTKYPDLGTDYTHLYHPQQFPFSEDDCPYGNRKIKAIVLSLGMKKA